MVSWNPAPDHIEEKLGALGQRAKKRAGYQLTPDSWRVIGNPKLNDSFEHYDVIWDGSAGVYRCECQTHLHGEHRKMCSHITYVILARRGAVPWTEGPVAPPELPTREPGFQNLPGPLPLFVDQGQEWTEGARQALDAHFGGEESPLGPLPEWVKLIRLHQWEAYCEIMWHLDGGKKVIFLSAPTGSGKTLLGEMVRRSFRQHAMYTCTTKTLQNQFSEDFPYASVIKGRSNYRTLNFPDTDWIAADLCEQSNPLDPCRYCHVTDACPYKVARDRAERSPLAVANVAYLMAEGNGAHTRFAGRGLVIVDEADALEEELMRYVEISISTRMQKLLGLKPPDKKTVADAWQPWVEEQAIPKVKAQIAKLAGAQEARDIRLRNTLNRLLDRLEDVNLDDTWVYTGYDQDQIIFKPVTVDKEAAKVLWHLGRQWLLMSATIISAQQMAEDLGLEDDEWALVEVESTFPKENRPIYVEPVANMTAKEATVEWPKAAKRLSQIADWHDERILVHTVSYKLADYLVDKVGKRAITYRSASEREQALDRFRESPNGILIAPSFERGIDLPYDQCRVVVVAKIPFPYLGDKQVSKRLYTRGGQGWYAMQTVRALVQMTGRAMRHADDQCEIYIIDRQFMSNIWKKSRRLLPEWWKDALVMGGSPSLAASRGQSG